MKKKVTLFSAFVSIALLLAGVVACSSGSEGGDGLTYTNTANGVGFNMEPVPSGRTFTMGEHVQSTTQTVTLTKNFWMGETEVTQGLWEAVWGTTWPETEPSSDYGVGPNKPAYNVSWYDAVAFCNRLTEADSSIASSERVYYSDAGFTAPYTSGTTVYADLSKKGYRLPTEAEWEYAARYIDGTSWNGGDHISGDTSADHTTSTVLGDYAWYSGNNGSSGTSEYGSKDVGQETANALGLKDMSGNVWEWCNDWYASSYNGGSITDPTGPTDGNRRVDRGGAWNNVANFLRCAYRLDDAPECRLNVIGFRLCRTAD